MSSPEAFAALLTFWFACVLLLCVIHALKRAYRLLLVEPALQPDDDEIAWWGVDYVPGGYRVVAERMDGSAFISHHTRLDVAQRVVAMLRARG